MGRREGRTGGECSPPGGDEALATHVANAGARRNRWLVVDDLGAGTPPALAPLAAFLGHLPGHAGRRRGAAGPGRGWRVIATADEPPSGAPACAPELLRFVGTVTAHPDLEAAIADAAGGDATAAAAVRAPAAAARARAARRRPVPGRRPPRRRAQPRRAGGRAHARPRGLLAPTSSRCSRGLDDRGQDRLKELLGAL